MSNQTSISNQTFTSKAIQAIKARLSQQKRKIAVGLLAITGLFANSQNAEAHFPFIYHRPFHHHVGYYGYSYYRPVYASSFYYSFPSYASYNWCGWPHRRVYYSSPVIYSSYYSSYPVYINSYVPPVSYSSCYSSCYDTSVSSPTYSDSIQVSNLRGSAPFAVTSPTSQSKTVMRTPAGQFTSVDQQQMEQPKVQYHSDWIDTAMELIDGMVAEGDAASAYSSCQQLQQVKNDLPASFHLRMAILASANKQSPSLIRAHFQEARRLGSKLSAKELPNGNLRSYLQGAMDIDASLESLAKNAYERDEDKDSLFVLAALLNLDGQKDRARLFAKAATTQNINEIAAKGNDPLQSVALDLSN